MIQEVISVFNTHNISKSSKLLCAVSGGIDSIVMMHCLHELQYNCIIAHCNFKLRGTESDKDEEFVNNFSIKLGYRFISESFDTQKIADSAGISTQMAARDLRFEWLYKMADLHECDYIVLAHNSDDQVETVIFNLIRGTGIRGLTGMHTLKGKLLRPLLNVSRKEIEKFVEENYVKHREDSTNIKTIYSRNKIRHLVFPIMEEINPNFRQNGFNTTEYLKDVVKIYEDYIYKTKFECVKYIDDKVYIDINKLKESISYKTMLFEIFTSESLPNTFSQEAVDLLNSQSGKICKYRNIQVLKDRDYIIISTVRKKGSNDSFKIYPEQLKIKEPIPLEFIKKDIDKEFKISENANYGFFDYDKLEFPLILRKWKSGDRFKPLGMNNYKKLSDFFSDIKLNIFQKSEQWILTTKSDEIIWIVGKRIDNRFKITQESKTYYLIKTE